jgi:hypothetical protein
MSEEKDGAARIAAERARQIGAEGYDAEHDDEHDDGSLAMAAACYAACAGGCRIYVMNGDLSGSVVRFEDPWPWSHSSDKRPHDDGVESPAPGTKKAIRMLEKAGALIVAEIDRQLRLRESGKS